MTADAKLPGANAGKRVQRELLPSPYMMPEKVVQGDPMDRLLGFYDKKRQTDVPPDGSALP